MRCWRKRRRNRAGSSTILACHSMFRFSVIDRPVADVAVVTAYYCVSQQLSSSAEVPCKVPSRSPVPPEVWLRSLNTLPCFEAGCLTKSDLESTVRAACQGSRPIKEQGLVDGVQA